MEAVEAGSRNNRRGHARSRAFKAARIHFNHGASTIDCTMRNLSETGAAIEAPSFAGVPDEFDVALLASELIRHCRVVWRSPKRIGVQFIDAAE
jgi:hypothetical protein